MTKETEHTLESILERIKVMYLDQGIVQKIPRFPRVSRVKLKSYDGKPPEFFKIDFDSYFFYQDIDFDKFVRLLRVRDFNKKIWKEVDKLFSIIQQDPELLGLLDHLIDYKAHLTPKAFFQDNSYRLWLNRDIYPDYESKALKETKDYFYRFLKKTANKQITQFDGTKYTIPI